MDIEVPELVRQRASANRDGRRWLTELPDIVTALRDQWELELGEAFSGGTAGYVVAATDPVGRACVLKIAMPLDMDDRGAFDRSVRVHRLADGQGCARLLADEPSVPAMLLERLGPNLHELGLPVPEVLDTIVATLRSFWRPVTDTSGIPTGADKAAWLAVDIVTTWEELDRPCSREVIDRAVSYCDERAAAFDPDEAVLVHGDAHGWNTLRAGEDTFEDDTFKFVDPEGVVAERAVDLSVPMREYNRPLLAGNTVRLTRARAEHLAEACDVNPDPVWQWGFIERVSTGLANVRDFDGDDGLAFLEVAERCC